MLLTDSVRPLHRAPSFKVFGSVLASGGVIKAINAKGLAGVPSV
jgi:hypothetical protein